MTGATLLYVTEVAPYTDGPAGVHGVLGQSAIAMTQLAKWAGLEPVHVPDVTTVDTETLAAARAVALFTIGETPWSDAQKAALLAGVRSGHTAIVAIHAATDSCYLWEEYRLLVGARFDGHPWTQHVDLDVVEPEHPATEHLGPRWRVHDEIYQYRELRPDARVLLRVADDQLDLSVDGVRQPEFGYPMSWCFTEGEGRVFSTTLGHFPAMWESTVYLRHLAGGLAWALGVGA